MFRHTLRFLIVIFSLNGNFISSQSCDLILEGQITDLDQQLEALEISKQEAIAAGDEQRIAELESQQQELTAQREQIVSQMEQEFGGERSELEGQITSLDDQLNQLQID